MLTHEQLFELDWPIKLAANRTSFNESPQQRLDQRTLTGIREVWPPVQPILERQSDRFKRSILRRLVQQTIVVLTAILASIGAAAVPSAGLVVIFIVLEAINLRGPEVNLIVGSMLAIDRPLDMYRTAVNVFSDSCGAAIIARSEGETKVDLVAR